jgi:uncharacterized peroxidase-related enzyme
MPFITAVSDDEATGAVAAMYEADRRVSGHLPNFSTAFSLRPDAYAAWRQLNRAIKTNMDPRRYELATVAAASRLRSSYCTLAHGSVLLDKFLSADDLHAVVGTRDDSELDALDAAVIALADKVALDATSVMQSDIDQLRALGLSDAEILDVVLAAAARCFFSKVLDGIGIQPDAKYAQLDPELRDALTVGRPIAEH